MERSKEVKLDFIVDGLTNSIRNSISGDSFQTEMLRLRKSDLRKITRKNGWVFDWKAELADNSKEVYKLTIEKNPDIIQGLLSLSFETDHILMNLVESAPFNIGKNKVYEGVAGNLVTYACKVSFQHGLDGFVAFTAKTKLIKHYSETLGAQHIGAQRMIISSRSATLLVEKYYKT